MKLSVLLLLALLALSSASPLDILKSTEQRNALLNPSLGERVPSITANQLTNHAIKVKRDLKVIENNVGRSSSLNVDQTNLEWQTFNGSLPNGAVSVYNKYVDRIDYVCKYGLEAGLYNPYQSPHCLFPYRDKELRGSPFEILVNKDNFEIIEWKDGSYGSVPENAVETFPGSKIYIGKNKYGLGKVDVKNEAFILPWEGDEYWHKSYQVLTFNKDVIHEDISDVKYKTDGVKVIPYPSETFKESVLTNDFFEPMTLATMLSKTTQKEHRWDTSFSLTIGANTTITAGIPSVFSGGIEVGAEKTFQFTNGTTYTEMISNTVCVLVTTPPRRSCRASMVEFKYGENIPYTARLSRTYRNGKTTWTSISGTYSSVQMRGVRSVVDRCNPVADPTPDPSSSEESGMWSGDKTVDVST
ncbi:natterin-3-like [Etheostoma cragini]|uniref:natterin-3-like n=1 Tax=Etheostoma cragini TaxID=417921 RepID=UPI00155F0109|nr:natterin-3-like [Etheostoma cragini]